MESVLRLSGFPEIYERLLVPSIFAPWAQKLIERARPIGPADRILDLGCGTGIVARILRDRLGGAARITGLDVNAGMLDKARSLAPDLTWVEGNAAALPFPDRSFEVVLAQQVLQFVPDRAAAAREIHRVLAPGGRLVASTWRPRREQPLYEALGQIAEKHLGPGNDKRWSLDGGELRALLADAGMVEIRHETVSLEERYSAFPVAASLGGSGYTNVDPAIAATIEAESAAVIERHKAPTGEITNRSVTNVVVARVP